MTDTINRANFGEKVSLRQEVLQRIMTDLPKLEPPGCAAKHLTVPYVDLENPHPTIMGLPCGRDIFYPLHKDETFINRFDLAHEEHMKDRESRLMSARNPIDLDAGNIDLVSIEMTRSEMERDNEENAQGIKMDTNDQLSNEEDQEINVNASDNLTGIDLSPDRSNLREILNKSNFDMLDLQDGARPRVESLRDIFVSYMNFFNFDQKDMINAEDRIEYTAYAQNLIKSMKTYF